MSRNFEYSSAQYLNSTNYPVYQFPLSISAWFKAEAPGLWTNLHITGMRNVTNEWVALFVREETSNRYAAFSWNVSGGSGSCQTSEFWTPGQWHHLCGVCRASADRSVWLDFQTEATNTTAVGDMTSPPTNHSIGSQSPGSSEKFDGSIAELAFWDTDLSDEEVEALSKGFSPLLVRPQNLDFYMPLVRDNDQDIIRGVSYTPVSSPTIDDHPRIIYPRPPQIMMAPADAGLSINISPEASYVQLV